MFQILYRCLYRPIWRDDIQPVDDFNVAVGTAQQIAAQRGTPVLVTNVWTGQVLYSHGQ